VAIQCSPKRAIHVRGASPRAIVPACDNAPPFVRIMRVMHKGRRKLSPPL
jgi:hypothetical protein